MADESPLIQQVNRLRDQQLRLEGAELERLVKAYADIHDAAQRNAVLLADEIARMEPPISPAKVRRLRRYRRMLDEIERELDQYQAFVSVELRTASKTALARGEEDARTLVRVLLRDAGVDATMRAINPTVIETLVGFLAPDGPLYKRLGLLSKYTAGELAKAILEGIGMGRNPRAIARIITNTMGVGLTESMRMMRTVQLWSYREANRASYLANSDVVGGWIWYAELDSDTCASCVTMHGTKHGLNESLNDHHNGRCSMIPDVIGGGVNIEQGSTWFDSLNEEQQKGILGASKWDAWKDGKFTLADVVGVNNDDVYGEMRTERSLKDLLGE